MNWYKMALKRLTLRQVILVSLMLLGLSIEGRAKKHKSAKKLETSNVGQTREGSHKRNVHIVDNLTANALATTNSRSRVATTLLEQANVVYEKLPTVLSPEYVSFAPKLSEIKAHVSFVFARKRSPLTKNDGDNKNGIRSVLPTGARIATRDNFLAGKHNKFREGKLASSRHIRLGRSVAEEDNVLQGKELHLKFAKSGSTVDREKSQNLVVDRSPSVTAGTYENEDIRRQHGGTGTRDLSKYMERRRVPADFAKDSSRNNLGKAGESAKYASVSYEGYNPGEKEEAEKESDGKILENMGSAQGNEEMRKHELIEQDKPIDSSNVEYGSSTLSQRAGKQLVSVRTKGILKTFTEGKSNHRNQEGFETDLEAKMTKEQDKLQDIETSFKQKEDEKLVTKYDSDRQDQEIKGSSEDIGLHASGYGKGNFPSDQKNKKISSTQSVYESSGNEQNLNPGDKRNGDEEMSSILDFKSSESDKLRKRADKIGKLVVTNANQKIVFNIYQPYHPPDEGISSSSRSDSEGLEDMAMNSSKTASEQEPSFLEPDKPEEQRKQNDQDEKVRYKENEELKIPLLEPDKPSRGYSDHSSDRNIDQKQTEKNSESTLNRNNSDREIQDERIQHANQRLHENVLGEENRKNRLKDGKQEREDEANEHMHNSVEEADIDITKNEEVGRKPKAQEQTGEEVRHQKTQPFEKVAEHVEKGDEKTTEVNENKTKEDHQSNNQHVRKEAYESSREGKSVAGNEQETEEKHTRQAYQQFSQDANRNEKGTGKHPIGADREKESEYGQDESQVSIETGNFMKDENEGKSPKYRVHEVEEESRKYDQKLNNNFSSSHMEKWNQDRYEHEMQEERGQASNGNKLTKHDQKNTGNTNKHANDVENEETNDRGLKENGGRQVQALKQNVQEERHQGSQRSEKETEHVNLDEGNQTVDDEHKMEEEKSRGEQTLNQFADRGIQGEEKRPKGHDDETEEKHEESVQPLSGSSENTDKLISGDEIRQKAYDQDAHSQGKDTDSQSDGTSEEAKDALRLRQGDEGSSDREVGARLHESNHGEGKNGEMAEEELEENSRIVLSELKHLQELAQSINPQKIDVSSLHPGTVRILKKLGEDHEMELNRHIRTG